MKKEKKIKTYTRKTKSGRVATVKAHTAKYDAADMAKEALKKAKGAGKEFEGKRSRVFERDLDLEDMLASTEAQKFHKYFEAEDKALYDEQEKGKKHSTEASKKNQRGMEEAKRMLDKKFGKKAGDYLEDNIDKYVSWTKKGSKLKDKQLGAKPKKKFSGDTPYEVLGSTPDSSVTERKIKPGKTITPPKGEVYKDKPGKSTKPVVAVSPEDYKAWYHWDPNKDPKNAGATRAEKALKAKMGNKEYNKYYDKIVDSYSPRGHVRAYKTIEPKEYSSTLSAKKLKGVKKAGEAIREGIAKEQNRKKDEHNTKEFKKSTKKETPKDDFDSTQHKQFLKSLRAKYDIGQVYNDKTKEGRRVTIYEGGPFGKRALNFGEVKKELEKQYPGVKITDHYHGNLQKSGYVMTFPEKKKGIRPMGKSKEEKKGDKEREVSIYGRELTKEERKKYKTPRA